MEKRFVRIACATLEIRIADCRFNGSKIINLINEGDEKGADFILFPELALTGCSCADLFFDRDLLRDALEALKSILDASIDKDMVIMVGTPLMVEGSLYNVNGVIYRGRILGMVPKEPDRWFSSGEELEDKTVLLFGQTVPVAHNLFFKANFSRGGQSLMFAAHLPQSPSDLARLTLVFNNRAKIHDAGDRSVLAEHMASYSREHNLIYTRLLPGMTESTGEGIYSGYGAVYEQGQVLVEDRGFRLDSHLIFTDGDFEKVQGVAVGRKNGPFKSPCLEFDFNVTEEGEPVYPVNFPHPYARCDLREIFEMQANSLAVRMKKINTKKAVIGVSGGLDSTLALLVVKRAFEILNKDSGDIVAITMPGFGTTKKTLDNSVGLIKYVKGDFRLIDIKDACLKHFRDIGHDENILDVTYENVQARERTQIQMDIANKEGGIVIGCSDLSELALGWCTYNGDHMSMYSVNCGVYKTLVKYILRWYRDSSDDETLKRLIDDVLDTPVSPELLPGDEKGGISQKTEEIIGPYELHDFFIHHRLKYNLGRDKIIYLAKLAFKDKYGEETVEKWHKVFERRFRTQQFKRSCLPEGPRVLGVSLSPRSGFFMPSDL